MSKFWETVLLIVVFIGVSVGGYFLISKFIADYPIHQFEKAVGEVTDIDVKKRVVYTATLLS